MEPNTVMFNKEWITNGINKDAIVYCSNLASRISRVSSSQLRNFFGELRRIQMKGYESNRNSFYMLKPKLVYAVARAKDKDVLQYFEKEISKMMDNVSNEKQFENFVTMIEAIVAYHKALEK